MSCSRTLHGGSGVQTLDLSLQSLTLYHLATVPSHVSGIYTIFLRVVIALPLLIISKKNMGKNKVQWGYILAVIEFDTLILVINA